jgi:hypothetical protein
MRAIFLLLAFTIAGASSADLAIDRKAREVRISAKVQPHAMDRPFGVQGHHAIVWKGGRSKFWALFVADASDRDVRRALDSLGAKRGENLTLDTWNAREDESSREPDKRVEGSRVEVFVEWKGSPRVPLASLLAEEGKPAPSLDFRYGGNERWQKDFKSGCIVCLYSCPGGAIGNHAHPIRDYVRDGVVYASRADRLPPSGTKVTIILKVSTQS